MKVEDAELARFLEQAGRLVRLGDGMAVGSAGYDEARRLLVEECEAAGSITLARFRDLLGTSRKPAQLLLERFDADGVTRRRATSASCAGGRNRTRNSNRNEALCRRDALGGALRRPRLPE